MSQNESGRGWQAMWVGFSCVYWVCGWDANRIKKYLFKKNVKIRVDDSFYMIYVNIVFGNCEYNRRIRNDSDDRRRQD
jgi:hypothetical protein